MIMIIHVAILLIVSGLVHIASVMLMPSITQQDTFSRLTALAPLHKLEAISPEVMASLPYADPFIRIAACRYDLARGPVRIRAPLSQTYLSVVLIDPARGIFSSVSDRAGTAGSLDVVLASPEQLTRIESLDEDEEAIEEIRIAVPKSQGVALVKVLVDRPSSLPGAEAVLANAQCVSESLPPL
jgi:uncharacterized membrane protein